MKVVATIFVRGTREPLDTKWSRLRLFYVYPAFFLPRVRPIIITYPARRRVFRYIFFREDPRKTAGKNNAVYDESRSTLGTVREDVEQCESFIAIIITPSVGIIYVTETI